MKISFSGSRSGRPLSHAWRASFTSGRSCSAACVVFFARDPPTLEEAPDRPDPEPLPPLFLQLRLEFLERDVGGLLDGPEDELRFFLDAIRPAIAARLLRSNGPHRFLPLGPADRARNAHPKPCRRPSARHPLRNRVNHTLPKIPRKRTSHACWPPSPAGRFNHKPGPLGSPPDPIRSGNALADVGQPDRVRDDDLKIAVEEV